MDPIDAVAAAARDVNEARKRLDTAMIAARNAGVSVDDIARELDRLGVLSLEARAERALAKAGLGPLGNAPWRMTTDHVHRVLLQLQEEPASKRQNYAFAAIDALQASGLHATEVDKEWTDTSVSILTDGGMVQIRENPT